MRMRETQVSEVVGVLFRGLSQACTCGALHLPQVSIPTNKKKCCSQKSPPPCPPPRHRLAFHLRLGGGGWRIFLPSLRPMIGLRSGGFLTSGRVESSRSRSRLLATPKRCTPESKNRGEISNLR